MSPPLCGGMGKGKLGRPVVSFYHYREPCIVPTHLLKCAAVRGMSPSSAWGDGEGETGETSEEEEASCKYPPLQSTILHTLMVKFTAVKGMSPPVCGGWGRGNWGGQLKVFTTTENHVLYTHLVECTAVRGLSPPVWGDGEGETGEGSQTY